ncbi:hypothetical protein SADUNF_Sadunf02G0146700 [Salix dunnii]|uniref:RRM domain-containing protein n=1 Tax=Salix dunnii TaxID=1413687 RepID=A0A835N7Y3_9ROSI|nr:hypothetical protein SADUNF_Sadunf02G0146700 [Salix dunnii]
MFAKVEYRCFVGGLAWATTNPYEEIINSKIINDRETERSRGFGFVLLAMRDATEGVNGKDLDGCNITLIEAQSCGSGGGNERQMGHRDERNESKRQRLNSASAMAHSNS